MPILPFTVNMAVGDPLRLTKLIKLTNCNRKFSTLQLQDMPLNLSSSINFSGYGGYVLVGLGDCVMSKLGAGVPTFSGMASYS